MVTSLFWPNLGAAEELVDALEHCGVTLPASVLQPIIAGSFQADVRLKVSGLTRNDRRLDDRTYQGLTPELRGRVDTCGRILGVEPVNLVSLAAVNNVEVGALLDHFAAGLGQFFSPDFQEAAFVPGRIPPAELESALSDLTAALNEQPQKQTGEAFERLWGLVGDCERAAPHRFAGLTF